MVIMVVDWWMLGWVEKQWEGREGWGRMTGGERKVRWWKNEREGRIGG